jgi:DNA-directed RNA polymerase specialized sigma24 family protein
MQAKAKPFKRTSISPSDSAAPPSSLEHLARQHSDRNQAIVATYRTGQYSYQEIGEYFGLQFTTVGQIVRKDAK